MRSSLMVLVFLWALGAVSLSSGCASETQAPADDDDVTAVAAAITVASNFVDQSVATGIASPTAMQFAPDGRLFVAQQTGQLRVISSSGTLLATPFLTVTVDTSGERGLLGVAFDPSFASNQYVYVYYTATTPTIHNRVSRFHASGDVATAGSETVLLDLPTLGATNHNGGALNFGTDGFLYVAVGENAVSSNSQSLASPLGKILRIGSDGSIPSSNPFYGSASGINRAIWAYGLRNPFTFAFQPGASRMFINDVGESTYEEIDDGVAGANFGWPTYEGPSNDASVHGPLFYYGHGTGAAVGCAIAGGSFYNPGSVSFPGSYLGMYFFADYCGGWIRMLNPSTGVASDFASGLASPVDLKVGPSGALYYLVRGNGGSVGRISYVAPLSATKVPALGAFTPLLVVLLLVLAAKRSRRSRPRQ